MVATTAQARKRVVDGGPVTYLLSGNGWHYNEVDLRSNAQCDAAGGPCAIPIGFEIDFGEGPVDHLYISENGVATFGAPLPIGDSASRPLASIRQPVIAPFYTDMISTHDVADGLGEISWGPGRIDPDEDPDLANDTSPRGWFDGERAFKVDWTGTTRPGAPAGRRCFVQIAIYDRGGGDFDLEFNYGLTEPTVMPLNGAEVGFRLASNFYRFNGASIDNSNDLVFRFRNGVLQP